MVVECTTVKALVISVSLFGVFSVQHKRHSLCELDFSFFLMPLLIAQYVISVRPC